MAEKQRKNALQKDQVQEENKSATVETEANPDSKVEDQKAVTTPTENHKGKGGQFIELGGGVRVPTSE